MIYKTPVLVLLVIFASLLQVVLADEVVVNSASQAAVMATSATHVPGTAVGVSAAVVPLSIGEATEMGGLRMVALVAGVVALVVTFYHALGRRPNSSHR